MRQSSPAWILEASKKRLNLCILTLWHGPGGLWGVNEKKKASEDDEETAATAEESTVSDSMEADLDLLSDLKPSDKLSEMAGMAKKKKTP